MRRTETNRRFDEIVAFAEIEEFLDTPVKHYSTGMYLRLAFAVAAHLDPDILLVDEVLAVGDMRFQKKCLNKMQDVGQQGRTVIFVSHNMPAISRLCERALLLENGRLVKDGAASDVVNAYLQSAAGTSAARVWPDATDAPTGEHCRLRAVRVVDARGENAEVVDIRKPVRIEVEHEVLQPDCIMVTHLTLVNEDGVVAFSSFDVDPERSARRPPRGRYVTTAEIPGNLLAEGTFIVSVGQFTRFPYRKQYYERDVVAFRVVDDIEGDSARGDYTNTFPGVVRPRLQWTTRSAAD
jgi:lipopolysaccharide transport system ATP-binding protein